MQGEVCVHGGGGYRREQTGEEKLDDPSHFPAHPCFTSHFVCFPHSLNLTHRDDAERAIRTLDGYGYDNLILHVEWAAPRAERS